MNLFRILIAFFIATTIVYANVKERKMKKLDMSMNMTSAKAQNLNAIDKLNNYYLLFNVAY